MIEAHLEKDLFGASGPFRLSVHFRVDDGQCVTFYGPSGAGKTTILRILAGLEKPQEGFIRVKGESWFDAKKRILLPSHKRRVGFVFQSYALFPNMTVGENIAYAMQKKSSAKLEDLLNLAGILELKGRYPSTLSGGQQQRVALIRAIAREPIILLLDEPLSALDIPTRLELQDEILRIHRLLGTATILVSHDKQEVFRMADMVLSIKEGRIHSEGSPREVFFKRRFSPKFAVTGRVLAIEKADIVFRAFVATGAEMLQVILGERDAKRFKPGDEVLVASKAFNPMLLPLFEPFETKAPHREFPVGVGYVD